MRWLRRLMEIKEEQLKMEALRTFDQKMMRDDIGRILKVLEGREKKKDGKDKNKRNR